MGGPAFNHRGGIRAVPLSIGAACCELDEGPLANARLVYRCVVTDELPMSRLSMVK
jgi:hypothetical protein